MRDPVFTFGIVALVLACGVALLGRAGRSAYRYKRRDLLTANEREFFHRLQQAHAGGYVFPQVSMGAVIGPAGGLFRGPDQQVTAFRKISQKRIDYTVCDQALRVVCVVELDDSTHDARRDAERDAMLASAGIKTLRWTSREKPSVAVIRAALARLAQEQRDSE